MVHAVHQIMAGICFRYKQRITRSITTSKLTYNFCVGYQKLKTDSIVITGRMVSRNEQLPITKPKTNL